MSKTDVTRLAIFAILSSLLTACGGSPAAGTVPLPAQSAAGGALLSQATTTASLQLAGSVTGISSGSFTVNSGYPHGFVKIATTSSTTYVPGKPVVGNSVSVTGTGTYSAFTATSVTTTTACATNATITATGTIVGLFSGGFTLDTGYPHGRIHIYTSAKTCNVAAAVLGATLSATGTGSYSAGITAMSLASTSTAAPLATPVPTATPVALATPVVANGTSTATMMPGAVNGMGLFQVFDAWGTPRISATEAQADAWRYGVVWGARAEMVSSWLSGNPSMTVSYYMPQETDASYLSWGAAGHTLTWWQTNHPDWVLYACAADGTPTTTPAYVGNLPYNIPLDFHNPAVVDYQVRTAANYAIAHGYNGLAFDEVLFTNIGGASSGTGAYGCGIYQNGSFVRRYASKTDPQWATDTVAWVKAAHALLTTDTVLAPHHLKMIVNHPAGPISDPREQTILANVDADLNETGFSDYGNYTRSTNLMKVTVDWTRYAQAHGAAALTIDKFAGTTAITPAQLEYAIATYLLANEGGSGLFAGNADSYGVEQYHAEYATNFGSRCGGYYGGSAVNVNSPDLWYRKYASAFVVVNSGSTTRSSESVTLPAGHTYRDLEGRTVTNPLTVANHDAYVLLTSNGCN